ncbi:cysteine desulfurase [Dissulfurispira thermophila]|uniref:cysteine desulfurase n=1 Tax=Dissulfurispira thermophila TaxID=2715679 RepID=A0A7G1H4X0_9BACT|nr:cysteine desulfurase family protein [Dissulfurispira thermophila]BCB96956.1 cysteine desulfurase [Dissulfurispira thermophila]
MIYLDCNATTPIDEEVKKAMMDAFSLYGNPSSSHSIGMAARAAVDRARKQVSDLIRCDSSEIIFTSGGTESNNLAIIGTAYKYRRGHIITSVIEHPAILNPVKWLEMNGFEATYIRVDSSGIVDPDDVKKAIRKDTILITIMHSNNETGVLQPIKEIGMIAHENNITFHTDAAQSIGKMDLKIPELMVDMLTVVSHKFYGPKGVGALYLRNGIDMMPIMFGAGHERGMRPGTENIIGILGFGKACEIALRDMSFRCEHLVKLRDMLFSLLEGRLVIKLNGHKTLRLPNTLNIAIEGIVADDIVLKLSNKIAFSSGSACHAGLRKPSPVLKAMGLSDKDALSSVRLSVGKDNTFEEIKAAAEIITQTINEIKD